MNRPVSTWIPLLAALGLASPALASDVVSHLELTGDVTRGALRIADPRWRAHRVSAATHRGRGRYLGLHRSRSREAELREPAGRADRGRLRLPALEHRSGRRDDDGDRDTAHRRRDRAARRRPAPLRERHGAGRHGQPAGAGTTQHLHAERGEHPAGRPRRDRDRLVDVLAYDSGAYEFRFPMVVGPRFIPGAPTSALPDTPTELQGRVGEVAPRSGQNPTGTGWSPDTTRVPDASRITPRCSAQARGRVTT